jgi:hypothetical protein
MVVNERLQLFLLLKAFICDSSKPLGRCSTAHPNRANLKVNHKRINDPQRPPSLFGIMFQVAQIGWTELN